MMQKYVSYSESYKEYSDAMKKTNLIAQLQRENHSLRFQVQKLKHTLQITDLKYKNVLTKAAEAGVELKDLEFETINIEDYFDLEAERSQESSLMVTYSDLPIDTETIFEQMSYYKKDALG
jgi:hypothetical protein